MKLIHMANGLGEKKGLSQEDTIKLRQRLEGIEVEPDNSFVQSQYQGIGSRPVGQEIEPIVEATDITTAEPSTGLGSPIIPIGRALTKRLPLVTLGARGYTEAEKQFPETFRLIGEELYKPITDIIPGTGRENYEPGLEGGLSWAENLLGQAIKSGKDLLGIGHNLGPPLDDIGQRITATEKPRPDIDELGFYSVVGRAIDELPLYKHQQVAPGDQVLKAIIKKGATKEEIYETGLTTFLQGKKGVTQQEVQDYFKANQVKLSEVVLRDKGDLTKLEWEDSRFISSEEYKAKKIESMIDSFNNYGGEAEVYNRLYSPAHGDFQSIYRYMSAIDNSKYSPENQHIYMGALQSEGIEGLDGATKKDFLQSLGDYVQKDITDAEMIGEKFKLFKTKDGMYEIFGEDQITGWSSISYGEAKGLADLADTIEEAKIQTQAYETDITLETGGEARWRDYASPGGENYEELLLTVPRRQLSDEARPRNYTDPHYRDIEDNIVAHLRTTKRDNVKVRGEIIETVHAEEIQSKVHSEGRKQGYVQEPLPITEEIQEKIDRYKDLKDFSAEVMPDDYFLQLKDEYALLKNELAPWLDRQSNRIADLPFKETWHEMLFNRLVYKAIKEGKDAVSWTVGKTQVDRYGDERLMPFYDTKLTGYAQKFSNKHGGAKVTHGTFKRPPDYEEVWVLPITKEMRSSILKEGNKQFKTGGLITKQKNFQSGGLNMARTKEATYDDTEDQMNMMGFDPREESIDPVSGNEVPLGGTPEGVRDNIDVKMSKGEMVIPEYAVNYHGVETYINSIQKAQQGYEQMQDMGLMGNPDEAIMDESEPLPKMKSEEVPEYQTGGLASFGDLSSVAIPQVPTSAVAVPQSATAEPIAQPLRPTSTVAVPQVVPVNNVALTAPLSEPLRPTSLQVTSDYSAPVGAAPIGASEEVSLYSNLASPVSTPPNIMDYVIKNNTPSIGDSSLSLQPQVAPSIGGGQGSAASASAPSGTASAAPAPSAQASAQAAAQAGLASTTAPGLAAISGLAADTTAAITKSTHAAHTQTPMQAAFSTLSLNDPSVDVVGKTISATDVASEVAKMALNSILPTVIPLPLSNVLNPISMVTNIANSIVNHASQPQMAVDQAARGVPNTGVHSATGYSFHAVPSLLGNLLGLDAIAVYNEKDPTAAPVSVDVALANMARSDNIDVSYYSNSELRSLYGLIDENGLRPNTTAELTPAEGAAHGMPTSEGSYLSDGSFMSKDGVHSATGTRKSFKELSTLDQAKVAVMRDKNDLFSFLTNIDMDDPANFSSLEAQTEAKSLEKSLIGNINLVSNTHPNLDSIMADQLAMHKTIEQHNYVVNKEKAEAAAEAKADLISQHNDLVNALKGLDASGKPTVTAPPTSMIPGPVAISSIGGSANGPDGPTGANTGQSMGITAANAAAANAAANAAAAAANAATAGGVTGQGPAPTPSSQMGGMGIGFGGGGGPSGGPGKIICLESHRQGLLDTKIFEADEAWGDIIPKIVLDGYHLWAKPVVRKMRKSRSFSKKVAWLAKPVAKEAAKQMGVGEGSKIGLAMLCVGMPICAILGAAMLPFKQKNTNLILGDK